MTNIAKIPKFEDLPVKWQHKLSNYEQGYVRLMEGEKVRDMEDNKLTEAVKTILKATWFTSGQHAPHNEDFNLTCLDFKNKIKEFYLHTSILDIQQALKMGVSKQLESTSYAMNISTFMEWINLYLFSHARTQAKISFQTLLQKSIQSVLDEKQQSELDEKTISDEYEYWKKTGEVINVGNVVFRTLWRVKKIRFSEEKRDNFLKLAGEIVDAENITQVQNAQLAGDKITLLTIHGTFDQTRESRIRNVAGSLVVKKYFTNLKTNQP